MIRLAKNWNEKDNNYNIFSQLNCYDYSKFCTENLTLYDYPSLRFYKSGKLVKIFDFIPDEIEILETVYL